MHYSYLALVLSYGPGMPATYVLGLIFFAIMSTPPAAIPPHFLPSLAVLTSGLPPACALALQLSAQRGPPCLHTWW